MRSAPALATARTSSPNRAKSAERMLGASRNVMAARVYNAGMAQEKQYRVAVSATTQYIAEQSDEAAGRYVFAYTIKIQNGGGAAALPLSPPQALRALQRRGAGSAGLGVVGAPA